MTETHLFLVRHGETQHNRDGIMQGRGVDMPLNATGREQAAALAQRLADADLDVVYASSLKRAQETARYVADHHPDVPLRTLDDLDEMAWGVYEGRSASSDAVEDVYTALHEQWDRGAFDARVDGGESIRDVQHRGLRAIRNIVAKHEGQTACIVTHGRFLRVLLASLLDGYGLQRMNEIPHSNAALYHVVASGDRYEARLLNCTAHLDEEQLAYSE